MKKQVLFLFITLLSVSLFSQQISIPRVDAMPEKPAPYHMRDWKQVAHHYDSLAFDTQASGTYLPLIAVNPDGVNYNHKTASMATYVGQSLTGGAEAINYLPALIGASLTGIDKSDQFSENWVLMAEDFFNRNNGENVYLNNYSGSSGNDWWYETMPNVFFYQLNDLYPHTGDFDNQFRQVADRWLEALEHMGGNTTPWETPYMNYRAWNLTQMEPLESGVKQPEAAGAIAWILYHAYVETGEENYRIGAEWAMEFLNNRDSNPSYELQLAYGIYTAARMNAEEDTHYDVDKMINWAFERGNLRGWGIITGEWGGYDCYGLRGEANDGGNDYAFFMNGIQQAAALIPMVRYNEHYANAIGKWLLNLANASRYFYSGFLPPEHQDNEEWALQHDPDTTIAHESMKEQLNQISPYATGDAVQGGWAPTNLALYGSSHVGYLGAITEKTNIEKILRLNLHITDFYADAYPSYLLWNPYNNDTLVTIDVGDTLVDIYNSRTNQVITTGVSGQQNFVIPGRNSKLLVCLPHQTTLTYDGKKTLVNDVVIDYDNGEPVSDIPPRIKALDALNNPVSISDSIHMFCTATVASQESLTYHWRFEDSIIEGGAAISLQAPAQEGLYEMRCVVISESGLADSASLLIEVKDKIPHIPEIIALQAFPGKTGPNETTSVNAVIHEENGDEVSVSWYAEAGNLSGEGFEISWTAPPAEGDYTILCTAADVDGSSTDSVVVMVRTMEGLQMGEPLVYLPFNGNTNDYSTTENNTAGYNISYAADSLGQEQSAAEFNGSTSYVNIENTEVLNFTDSLTVAGWIYSRHDNSGEAYPVSHGSWEDRWKVSLNNQVLRATINTREGIADLDSDSRIKNHTWYHFAVVYTGQDLELYIDGELDTFLPWQGTLNETTFDLVLGKARPDQEYFFEGMLDDFYLFDHALAPENIRKIYNSGVNNIEEQGKPAARFIIFPNPARNYLTLQATTLPEKNHAYTLMSLTGKQLLSGSWNPGKEKELTLNTHAIKSGIYLLSVSNGFFHSVSKVVITK
jgi:hypothetical protein